MRKIITKDETKNLNKYGLLKLDYLKKNNKVLYQRLIIEDKLNTFLFSVGKEAEEKVKFLINELAENEMLDIMPETNYKAAVAVIDRWKREFPETYKQLQKEIDEPVSRFVIALENYSITAYERFERIYPKLTAGSVFNPFLGFDVVELYEGAVKGLRKKGYTGIYVVYDEFSKFLEANISEASPAPGRRSHHRCP